MNQDYWSGKVGRQRVDLLKHLWGTQPAREIAVVIGTAFPPAPTRLAIIGKADRLGLPIIGETKRCEWAAPICYRKAR